MRLIHSSPWQLAAGLGRDADRLLRAANRPAQEYVPAVDIHEETARYIVSADLPGIDPAAIELTVDGDLLTIRGERAVPTPGDDATQHRSERPRGRFERRFRLPETVAADGYEAEYRHGVLTILIPKAPEATPYRIEVTAH